MLVFQVEVVANPLELLRLARYDDVVCAHDDGIGGSNFDFVIETADGENAVLVFLETARIAVVDFSQSHADKVML